MVRSVDSGKQYKIPGLESADVSSLTTADSVGLPFATWNNLFGL